MKFAILMALALAGAALAFAVRNRRAARAEAEATARARSARRARIPEVSSTLKGVTASQTLAPYRPEAGEDDRAA